MAKVSNQRETRGLDGGLTQLVTYHAESGLQTIFSFSLVIIECSFTKYVFGFFEPFFARLTSKFAKSANMTPKIFFLQTNLKRYQKTQKFTLISNPLKKL
jgi:hypothetical protein